MFLHGNGDQWDATVRKEKYRKARLTQGEAIFVDKPYFLWSIPGLLRCNLFLSLHLKGQRLELEDSTRENHTCGPRIATLCCSVLKTIVFSVRYQYKLVKIIHRALIRLMCRNLCEGLCVWHFKPETQASRVCEGSSTATPVSKIPGVAWFSTIVIATWKNTKETKNKKINK